MKALSIKKLALAALFICSNLVVTAQTAVKPVEPRPAWAPDIKQEMESVIDKLESFNAAPIPTLTPKQARKNPTPTDAVMALMKENNIPMPPSMVDTTGKDIPVAGGKIHLRIYTPKNSTTAMPIIVYYHGGGWVIASPDVYDSSARGLAEQVGAIVVSVNYRKAPEHKFPTAHNDSYAAYEWTMKNAAMINGDPGMIAVAGESAGGNLAASVSMMARDKGFQMPVHQLLVYPIASYDFETASYKKYAKAKPLDKPLMQWFFMQYLRTPADGKSPWISLVNANLKNLPPATIIRAEIDPLESDGRNLEQKLEAAGVKVDGKTIQGVTHEFFGMATVVPQAKEAQAYAVSKLKDAFGLK